MNEIFLLIAEVGFPIAMSLIGGFFIFLTIMELIIVLLKWYLTGFGELGEINHMIIILMNGQQ